MKTVQVSEEIIEYTDFWEDDTSDWLAATTAKEINLQVMALSYVRCGDIYQDMFARIYAPEVDAKKGRLFEAVPRAVSHAFNLLYASIFKFRDYQTGIITQINQRNTLSQFTLLRGLHELCASMSHHSSKLSETVGELRKAASDGNWMHMEKLLIAVSKDIESIFLGTTLYEREEKALHVNKSLKILPSDIGFAMCVDRHIHDIASFFKNTRLRDIITPAFEGNGKVKKWESFAWLIIDDCGGVLPSELEVDFDAIEGFLYSFLCQMVHPNEGSNMVVGFDEVEHFYDASRSHDLYNYSALSLKMLEMYGDLFLSICIDILQHTSDLEDLGFLIGSGGDFRNYADSEEFSLLSSVRLGHKDLPNQTVAVASMFRMSLTCLGSEELKADLRNKLGLLEGGMPERGLLSDGSARPLFDDICLLASLGCRRKVFESSIQRRLDREF